MKQILRPNAAVWRSIALCTLASIPIVAIDNRFVPSAPASAVNSNSDVFNEDYYYYGTGDGIATWQHDVISNLQFPQTYDAIVNRLGYPDARSESGMIDYYQLPAGGFVAVEYDQTGAAIGYSTQMGG